MACHKSLSAGSTWNRSARNTLGVLFLLLAVLATTIGRNAVAADEVLYTISSGRSDESAISTDGKWIAYRKDSSEVWVVKRTDLNYRRMVSVSTDGTPPSPVGTTRCAAISGNGRYVAFISGTRFCQDDPIGGQKSDRAYIHDRDFDGDGVFDEPGGTRTMLTSSAVELFSGLKYYTTISANGQMVAFSNSGAGDGNEAVWRQGGSYKLTEQYLTSFSGNGNFCVFNGAVGSGGENITTQVLMRMSMAPGPGTCISTNANGMMANGDSGFASFSPDGNYIAFYSKGDNLTVNDENVHNWDVFLKSFLDSSVIRCSVGVNNTGDANMRQFARKTAVSEGGRFVAFISDSPNLVEGVPPLNDRIFLYDTLNSTTSVFGLSSADFAWSPSISGNGRYLVFTEGNDVFLVDRGAEFAKVAAKITVPEDPATLESFATGARVDFEPSTFKEPVIVEMTAELLELIRKSPLQLGGSSMGVGVVGPSAPSAGKSQARQDVTKTDLTMLKPYKIVLSYLDQDLGSLQEDKLALYYWDTDQNTWIMEPTSVLDAAANTITASHLGVAEWIAMAVTEGEGEGEVQPEGEGEVQPEGEGEVQPEGEGEAEGEDEGENIPPTEAALRALLTASFAALDTNGDSQVSYAEALSALPGLPATVFNLVDANGDGQIGSDEAGIDESSGGCPGCKGSISLNGLKKAFGDLFLLGLSVMALSALGRRRR